MRQLAHISGADESFAPNAFGICLRRGYIISHRKSWDHIWWGVSVENRKHGLPRIDDLRQSGAQIKFLSCEPLLEDLGKMNLCAINWVIVGGESGPGARPMSKEWVLKIREQCRSRNVPFFFKQWGGVQKSRFGRKLNGRTYDEFPKIAATACPDRASRFELLNRFPQPRSLAA